MKNDKNYIIMGVTGSGKSTVGSSLAQHLNLPFLDADDFHSPENIIKMSAGTPLSDDDRKPWLETLAQLLIDKTPCVLACSALKQSYRSILRTYCNPNFFFLNTSEEVLRKRLKDRANHSHHFMPTSLLHSQLTTLEIPQNEPLTFEIDSNREIQEIVSEISRLA